MYYVCFSLSLTLCEKKTFFLNNKIKTTIVWKQSSCNTWGIEKGEQRGVFFFLVRKELMRKK